MSSARMSFHYISRAIFSLTSVHFPFCVRLEKGLLAERSALGVQSGNKGYCVIAALPFPNMPAKFCLTQVKHGRIETGYKWVF